MHDLSHDGRLSPNLGRNLRAACPAPLPLRGRGRRELPNLSLKDALQLVHLYAERGSPKYERAALRWLARYLTESSPRLSEFAKVSASLARREEP